MTLIKSIFSPLSPIEKVVAQFARLLDVRISDFSLKIRMEEHPDYPSLLSLSDVLQQYGVKNVSLKVPPDQLFTLPTPFIAQMMPKGKSRLSLVIVNELTQTAVHYIDPEIKKEQKATGEEFKKKYLGVVLVPIAVEGAGEKDYNSNKREELRKTLKNTAALFFVPLLLLVASLFAFSKYGFTASIAPVLFALLALCGVAVSAFLLLYEINANSPVLDKVCSGGKKTDCNHVLTSKASKLFGISWSRIGFTYFSGMLLAMMISGIVHPGVLKILYWINLLGLPYIAFSVFYQWRIAKQWCRLCLFVQALLGLQFIAGSIGGFSSGIYWSGIPTSDLLMVTACFAGSFIAVSLLLPLLRQNKENLDSSLSLKRFKNNPEVFDALLKKQPAITSSPEGLGITFGRPDAKHKLVKVCNPYCAPCAKAHQALDELVNNHPDIQLQIIFTAKADENDHRYLPVNHFLTLADTSEGQVIHHALSDWYNQPKKDYTLYAGKYPINEDARQMDKIEKMREWCDGNQISYTPTIYFNGHRLPDLYNVSDLKYFLPC